MPGQSGYRVKTLSHKKKTGSGEWDGVSVRSVVGYAVTLALGKWKLRLWSSESPAAL